MFYILWTGNCSSCSLIGSFWFIWLTELHLPRFVLLCFFSCPLPNCFNINLPRWFCETYYQDTSVSCITPKNKQKKIKYSTSILAFQRPICGLIQCSKPSCTFGLHWFHPGCSQEKRTRGCCRLRLSHPLKTCQRCRTRCCSPWAPQGLRSDLTCLKQMPRKGWVQPDLKRLCWIFFEIIAKASYCHNIH